MKGDNLEAFHNTLNLVISELSQQPVDQALQLWYFWQIEHFKPMSEDIAHYKRAKYEPGNLYTSSNGFGQPHVGTYS